MKQTQSPWWDGLLCGCLVILAVRCALPLAEMGFCDDFSYVKTALVYAQTGHLVYNGGATAMLGWQIPWGALFIRLFGFSFATARWSTLVTALATEWLFFLVLIRFGISRRNAYFGTLLLGLSPVFIPLAASFVTDISSLFVIVLCIYLCRRAVDASTDSAAIGWLVAAAATNVAGGTVRQIAWLGALVMVPSTAWFLRKRRGVLVAGLVFWCLSVASIFALMQWWQHQPYSLPETILPKQRVSLPFFVARTTADLIKEYLCLSLLIFPLLAAWLRRVKSFRPRALAAILAFTLAFQFFSLRTARGFHMLPWMRDVLSNLGLNYEFSWALGSNPVIINDATRFVLSYIIMAVAVLFLVDLFANRLVTKEAQPPAPSKPIAASLQDPAFWILVPFTVSYLALLIPRGLWAGLLDRYLLCLLPFAIIGLLKLYQQRFSLPLPAISYALLAAMAVFSIGGTHDWFALDRARLQAASILHASGVPDTEIQVGLDYDGWTQFAHSPTIVDPRIRVPSVVYHPGPLPNLAPECILFSWTQTPVVDPKYFVVISPMSCLAPSHFVPVSYHAWLPPFQRTIYIQQRP